MLDSGGGTRLRRARALFLYNLLLLVLLDWRSKVGQNEVVFTMHVELSMLEVGEHESEGRKETSSALVSSLLGLCAWQVTLVFKDRHGIMIIQSSN